jgi:4'-phosphopantetheinyl transferase
VWLTRSLADVPGDDGWLTDTERAVLATLVYPKRRSDWRLGRWTAKAVVVAVTGAARESVSVLAARDGAPEAFVDGRPAGVSMSISHRAGRALAVAGPGQVGCDLEIVEPRSRAFAEDWLTAAEREWAADDHLRTNAVWTVKEAAAKVRREGLRLDFRSAEATLDDGTGPWRAFVVEWGDRTTRGWWRAEGGWVMAVAAEPATGPPRFDSAEAVASGASLCST